MVNTVSLAARWHTRTPIPMQRARKKSLKVAERRYLLRAFVTAPGQIVKVVGEALLLTSA